MAIALLHIHDDEKLALLNGRRLPDDEVVVEAPYFVPEGGVDVKVDGVPFVRLERTDRPGLPVRLPKKVWDVILPAMLRQDRVTPCTDRKKYPARLAAAKVWVASLPALVNTPMGKWRDEGTPIIEGRADRLVRSFALDDEDALAFLPAPVPVTDLAALRACGTFPADMDGREIDTRAIEEAAARKRSEEAHARLSRQALEQVEVTCGEAGIEGFMFRAGTVPHYEHLVEMRYAIEGRRVTKPASLTQGGWNFWLHKKIAGLELPADMEGAVPSGTVLRITRAQLANIFPGWGLLHTITDLRAAYGAVTDPGAIPTDMLIGEGDRRCDAVVKVAENMLSAAGDLSPESPKSIWALNALARGLALRPEIGVELLDRAANGTSAVSQAPGNPKARRASLLGTFNLLGDIASPAALEEEAPFVQAPRWPRADIEAKYLAVLAGAPDLVWMSPFVLLKEVEPGILETLASMVTRDEWVPVLKAEVRRDGKYTSEELCKLVGGDRNRKADTSRVKRIMGKLGFQKKDVVTAGVREKVYVATP